MMFFLKKQLIKFSCTYWAFYFCKIFTKFLGLIQSYEDVPFSSPKWPICHEQFFWYKPLLLLSSTYCPFSLCKILKKFFQRIQSYEDVKFLGPKWPISPNEYFFSENLLMSLVSFINADIRCYMILNIRCQILIY